MDRPEAVCYTVFLHVRACDRYYDPREAVRAAEVSTVDRLQQCFEDLQCTNIF